MSRNNVNRYLSKLLFLAMALCFADESSAESSPLKQMFDRFKENSNYTSAGGYQSQASGHYTGGGLAVRNRTRAIQPIQVSLPYIGASCNGIDAYFGAVSFIKKDELTQMLRNVGRAAPSYAFQLALKTLSPEIEGLMKEMRKILMEANSHLLDECKATQTLFAATMPKGSEFLKHACTDIGSQGRESDWFGARERCAHDAAARKEAEKKIEKKAPDQLVGDYNLTWHVLMKIPGFKNDIPLAEFIQSIVGTIITKNEGDIHPTFVKSGKGDSEKFIEDYVKGAAVPVLQCDEPKKCLNPTFAQVQQGKENSFSARIYQFVDAIQTKFITKQALTPAEIAFIEGVQGTPIYGFIQVTTANRSQALMDQVVTQIAYSFLMHEFDGFAAEILTHLGSLEKAQIDTKDIEHLRKNIQQVRQNIARIKGAKDMIISRYMHQTIKMEQTRARSRSW